MSSAPSRSATARQLRMVLRLVRRRALRSGLAAGGIAVAVGTLLVAESLAERGRRAILETIRRMGADVLVVDARASQNRGGRARINGSVTTLTDADAKEIALRVPDITMIAAEYRSTLPVKAGDLARQVTVSGDEPSYGALREAPIARGRFYTAADDAGAQRVAVLGAGIATDLFGSLDVVGLPIRIRGVPFTIIGVLPERGTGLDAFSEDETIFVPLTTARERLFNISYVQRIFIRATRGADLSEVAAAVTSLLERRHTHAAGDPLDFRVQDQRRLVNMERGAATRLAAFEVSVAVLLLVGGGGGIFALQALSVRERRGEIGTRRAVGATRREIFTQFVMEATVVSVLGEVVGLAAGNAGVWAAGVPFPPALTPLALGACLIACLGAAAVPAWRAAIIPPAVALRT